MFGPSIRRRLLFTFTLVTTIGGIALFLIAGRQLQNSTLRFYQQDLETEAVAVASGLSEGFSESRDEGTSNQFLQAALQRSQTNADRQFAVLDTHRQVVASANPQAAGLIEQLVDTPEITTALSGRPAHGIERADGRLTAYAATPVIYEAQVLGVLVLTAPMEPAYEEVRRAWIELAVAALPILLLTVGASLWLGQALSRPIRQLHASALRMAEGALDERVAIKTKDEIGQLGTAFNFMAERLSLLVSAQRNFVSNAAHELRTPLMTLKLRVEALEEDGLTAEQRRLYLQEAAQEIEHMANLVTGLLTLARLDESRHLAQPEAFDVVALLQDIARHWRIQARPSQLDFKTEIPETLPEIAISPGDLRMVLDNLLNNAIKYTPPRGWIRLTAGREARTVWLEVADSGVGFSQEDSIRLFERFFRAENLRGRQVSGTGLGLAIVRSIVEHYGGTIAAHSDGPHRGASFRVTLPISA